MKPDFGAADHGARSQGQQGRRFGFDEALKSIPNGGRCFAQLGEWIQSEVEQDQWQISIAQKEISGFECFGGLLATDPEKSREIEIQSGGIEAISSCLLYTSP